MSKNETNEDEQKTTKKKKRSPLPFILIIAGCAAVLAIALVNIIRTQMEYKHSDDITNNAVSAVISSKPTASQKASDGDTANEEATDEEFVYDHDAALALNPDAKGVIYIPSTDIMLPIVQRLNDSSNEYYLHRGFDGQYSRAGTVYIDTLITDGLNGKHVILYGHHMGNGTMFSDNDLYRDKSFYDQPGNDVFYIYTPDSIREYKIFSVYTPLPEGEPYFIFDDEDSLREHVAGWKNSSLYDTGVNVDDAKQVVTLSSCDIKTNYKKRLVIQGILVSEKPASH